VDLISTSRITFPEATEADGEALATLRVVAMRESLERVGRFDPVRARERFLSGFSPEHTRHIVLGDTPVGFFVVKPQVNGLLLDHLYVSPVHQGAGTGAAVLATVFAEADAAGLPVFVGALRESASNRFYTKHGFALVEQSEFDNLYVRPARNAPDPAGAPPRPSLRQGPSRLLTPMITSYSDETHRAQVIHLWETAFGYETAHNTPSLAIDRKLQVQDGLFFVAVAEGAVVGTILAGYDGHRGWLYAVAVDPLHRHRGLGRALVAHAEEALTRKGCMKINLQIVAGNEPVSAFYASLGYAVEARVSMGKRVLENIPQP
jgi:GNAT superfamily N-acetyltransferase